MNRPQKALIKDVTINNFYHLVGEVVKLFSLDASCTDLYVTDYTTNEDLFLYEDPEEADPEDFVFTKERKWRGPFGQMTMAIRVWEPHASYARNNIREGDVVFLQAVHTKLSAANKLEGAIHQDRTYLDRINIRKVTYASQLSEHKARKEAYERAYALRKASRNTVQHAPKKPSAKTSAKKKETKREMQRLQKELELKELEQKTAENAIKKAGLNENVKASHPEIRLSTIEEIVHNPFLKTRNPKGVEITLPFVNAKYRTRVRVVDFYPKNLEDFAHPMSDPNWNTALNETRGNEQRHESGWTWGFVLLVEDANVPAGTTPKRLRLFVNNSAGQHLLNMDAVDLRRDPNRRALKQLTETLFILWGNLFELKSLFKRISFPLPSGDSRLRNLPFECCIEEYGNKVSSENWPLGWQRMHQPMGTLIVN
ncbi:hypothetical protein K504DRAFT_439240 [Pleomassaria siparia CBS 279.74]|uniref:Protection of telomeres protein 1 ssDNA-binding domain-containing protein n=1 Tax=Pleomassaria siparia CBS 279.74 TaxID=1314801 RepID=A0A6G1K057_9PLEO|nr:hypothetical protein K504DRAFT_439240 [Pleomassaria siparia CBS 279.74]